MIHLMTALVLVSAAPPPAPGPIDTAMRGPYVCELPGDAAGPAALVQPERGFTIESASRYSAPQGAGTYLRRGDRLEMTSGPRKGEAYQVVRPGFLRLLGPDGNPGRLRCVRQPG